MRILNLVLGAFMVLFAAVQYNDPDGPLWAALYAVPAFWAGLAGLKPAMLQAALAKAGLAASLVLYLVLTVVYWPAEAAWWRMDIWWESEESREGMGLMICSAVIAAAGLSMLLGRSRPAPAGGRA
ncbi:MAG TPA: transmembrane 220 family protein [Afifellaceae bacterium]|nr:transmembrane 220 family protein [Afifellaceae bacterium]